MASTTSQSQKSSRWGSFLSSVESRLDNILADEQSRPQQKPQIKIDEPAHYNAQSQVPPIREASPAPSASSNRAQERLNEKLAKARANRALAKKDDETPMSSGVPSRTGSPAITAQSPRESAEIPREATPSGVEQSGPNETPERSSSPPTTGDSSGQAADGESELNSAVVKELGPLADDEVEEEDDSSGQPAKSPQVATARLSGDTASNRPSIDGLSPDVNGVAAPSTTQLPGDAETLQVQIQADRQLAEDRKQEEVQELLEKIDALQSKLQYLTKEAAESARAAATEAKYGSLERKLADKDEKIALLIEEGQTLSQKELKHMTVIKKLRAKASDDERAFADARKTLERQERATKDLQEKLRRAGAAERQSSERLKSLTRAEKDLDAAKADREAKDTLIRDLQAQLSELTSASKVAEEQAKEDAFLKAKKAAAEFEDELAGFKVEKELAEKQHQNVLREMREKAEREKERARVSETERQGELSILESRLEAYRARAEEASAGEGGVVQAKLLRQIETLQNQYAVASENWQGIEGSLTARVVALENERDEVAKREGDIRRKARESNNRCRRLEEEVERSHSRGDDLEVERTSLTSQIKTLRDQLNWSEAEMNNARIEFKMEREGWELRHSQRLEEERSKMRDEYLRSSPSSIYTQIKTEYPGFTSQSRRATNTGDYSSPPSRRVPSYSALGFTNASHSPHDRPSSRRSSTLIMNEGNDSRPSTSHPMTRTDSMSTVPNISLNNGIPETPSIDYDAQQPGDEDFFTGIHTPATPPERTINDLVSQSTAGAGPSVQLVERMSAAVRRLESEKEVHKDELIRLARQRDDAREQVVELMRDNDAKKAVDERVQNLEAESKDIRKRYETTLEMLGEKSEKVEELKADIVDLKTLLREMVEERVK